MNWYKTTSRFIRTQEDLGTQIDEAINALGAINHKDEESLKKNIEKPFYVFSVKSPYFSDIITDPIPVNAYYRFPASSISPATVVSNLRYILSLFKNTNNLEIIPGKTAHAIRDKVTKTERWFVSYIKINLLGREGKEIEKKDLRLFLYHELIHIGDPAVMMGKVPSSHGGDFLPEAEEYYNNPTEFNAYSSQIANGINYQLKEIENHASKMIFINHILDLARNGNIEQIFSEISTSNNAPLNWNKKNRKTFLSRIYNFIESIKQKLTSTPQASGNNWYKITKLAQTYDEIEDDQDRFTDSNAPGYFDAVRYFSIGQNPDSGKDSICWIYDGKELKVAHGGTHASNFPEIYLKKGFTGYRGWHDPTQKLISVIIPRVIGQVDPALEASSLPTKLRVALSDKFGTDNKLVVF